MGIQSISPVSTKDESSGDDDKNKQPATPEQKPSRSTLDTIAAIFVIATVFLLPLFFIPDPVAPFQATKGLLLVIGVLGAAVLWLIARLKDGIINIPKTPFLFAGLALVVVYFLSALFSSASSSSLTGTGFEIDTFATMAVLIVALTVVPLVLRRTQQLIYLYGAFLLSAVLLGLFQLTRVIFGADTLSFGIFFSGVSNLVGGWNDLGIFFGLSALFSLTTIELLDVRKPLRIFASILLVLSLFFLALINFATAWYLLGIFALIFFTYTFASGDESEAASSGGWRSNISFTSLGVFLVAVVFIVTGGAISNLLSEAFNIAQVSARPSWQSTYMVMQSTLAEHPLLGVGPNRFDMEWVQYKPDGVNETLFWNTDFRAGIGLLPSTPVVVGLAGAIVWIIFLGLYLYLGIQAILKALGRSRFTRFLVASSFFSSLYLWVVSIFYVPNLVLLFLTFAFTGVFIAVLAQHSFIPNYRFSFEKNPKAGFISVLAIVLLLIAALSSLYLFGQKYMSAIYFQNGIVHLNRTGNLERGSADIRRAISVDEQDRYYRALAQINVAQLSRQITESNDELSQNRLQTMLGDAIDSARRATELDRQDYKNWLALGGVYETLVPHGVSGAYSQADRAYQRALERNPRNPAILLQLARLEFTNNNTEKAREYVQRAIREKSNYTEAIFFLAQIQTREGEISAAIDSVRAAAQLSPNDPSIFFQLGLLYYEDDDYQQAITALSRAINLAPNYANAQYFLGLSFYEVGQVQEAVSTFEQIRETNPDNAEVQRILENLRSGDSPFANTQTSGGIEDRDELPIEE